MAGVATIDAIGFLVDAGYEGLDPGCRVPGNVRCPFHDDNTASLYLWNDHWRCFVCDIGGNSLDLIARALGGTRSQAKKLLEGALGEEIEWQSFERPAPDIYDFTDRYNRESLLVGSQALEEAEEYWRTTWPHIEPYNGELWGIAAAGYYLMIPHWEGPGPQGGRMTGVKCRTFVGGNKDKKHAFAGSTYPRLYRVEERPDATAAWLVEGETDTWTVTLEHPDEQVFGLPSGASTWRQAYRDELLKYETIWVGLDADKAGDDASERIMADLVKAGHKQAYRIRPVGYNDWTERAVALVSA